MKNLLLLAAVLILAGFAEILPVQADTPENMTYAEACDAIKGLAARHEAVKGALSPTKKTILGLINLW